jgi:hypothetical protein
VTISCSSPDSRGGIALRMTSWDGRQSRTRFFATWTAAVRFMQSDEFTLMRDIRLLTVKQTARPRKAPGGSHWKPSAEEAAQLGSRAQREFVCGLCGALPGSPCADPESGHTVHAPRYAAARKAVMVEARTPEQRAALERLPPILRSEIEKCRRPDGNYSFPGGWFEAHGIPFPPPAGWRAVVERDDDLK